MAGFVLTPYIFKEVQINNGEVVPIPAQYMVIFGPTFIGLFLWTSVLVITKYIKSSSEIKRQWWSIGAGLIIAYALLTLLIFFRVIFYKDTTFVPYTPLFTLPIFLGAAYAILRHNLFNIKVVATEILTFILLILSFVQIFAADSNETRLINIFVSIFVLWFGILLIRSVLREIKQREKLEELSKELKQANETLEETNVKLEKADQMKSQFLSFASHQVKSPMTVVKGYADLIKDGSFGDVPDKVKETAEKIKQASDRLISLVNNLLDLRKFEEGRIEYNFAEMDIAAMTKSVYEETQTLASEKGVELKFNSTHESVTIVGDEEKLRQVVQNLIDNSIKYTEEGWVKVDLDTFDDKVQITVSDSGIGIPADILPTLFEQFNRGSKEAKKIKGTGLGLYIAKQFVEAHKGTVVAKSEGEGKGSQFIVQMPIKLSVPVTQSAPDK